MNILFTIWSFFATYILQKAPYMVGFLTRWSKEFIS